MGNIHKTPGADEDISVIQNEDIIENLIDQNPNEIANKQLEEIQNQKKELDLRTANIMKYFNRLVNERYRKELSHFRQNYKIKKNFAMRQDLIYKIYVIENIFTKLLYNLKVFKINLSEFPSDQFGDINHETEKSMLSNDLEIMQCFRNPNVETLFDFYIIPNKLSIIVMAVCTYSTPYTLLDAMNEKISKNSKFSDDEFQQIMKFLLQSLNKMKNKFIIHKGLSPSSIYFQRRNDYSSLILKNFFFSSNYPSGTSKGLTGTLWYSAPEILNDHDQDYKVDVYSVGIILYQVLTLKNIYQEFNNKEDVLKQIEKRSIHNSLEFLSKLGYNRNYLDLIKTMVEDSVYNRNSIEEMISNNIVKEIQINQVKLFLEDTNDLIFDIQLNESILENLKYDIKNTDKNIRGAIFYIFKIGSMYILDYSQIIKINMLFDYFDVNNNNLVTTDEFSDKLKELIKDNYQNKEELNRYADLYKTIIELIFDNGYFEYLEINNRENKQLNFKSFIVASLIIWFYSNQKEKNYSNFKMNTSRLENKNNITIQKTTPYNNEDLNKSNNTNLNISKNNKNLKKNTSIISDKNNLIISKNKNNISNNFNKSNQSKIYLNDNTNKQDLFINKNITSDTNENRLKGFFNAFFDTPNFISFDKLFVNKRDFDIKIFSQIEDYLTQNFMYDDEDNKDNIFIMHPTENKNFMSKKNFIKFLEFKYKTIDKE